MTAPILECRSLRSVSAYREAGGRFAAAALALATWRLRRAITG